MQTAIKAGFQEKIKHLLKVNMLINQLFKYFLFILRNDNQ